MKADIRALFDRWIELTGVAGLLVAFAVILHAPHWMATCGIAMFWLVQALFAGFLVGAIVLNAWRRHDREQ